MHTILITGGAGFIGSNLLHYMVNKYPDYRFVNLDALTYAGNLSNLRQLEDAANYVFVKGDIRDADLLTSLFAEYQFDGVIHLAAESHVDRSITNPIAFAETNILGTLTLLNVAKTAWNDNYEGKRFYHVSTDEVFGSLDLDGVSLRKKRSMRHVVHIRQVRHHQTILYALMLIPMVCL